MVSSLISHIKLNLKKKKIVLLQKKTKFIIKLLNALWDEKLIYGYYIFKFDFVKIYLKFNKSGESLIQDIKLISKTGRRVYMSIHEIRNLKRINENYYIFFNTSKGILSHKKALAFNVGGEVLFSIQL